jgi:hypothetical protein
MKQIFFRFSCILRVLCSIINLRSLEQMPCTELDVLVLRQSGLLEAPRQEYGTGTMVVESVREIQ